MLSVKTWVPLLIGLIVGGMARPTCNFVGWLLPPNHDKQYRTGTIFRVS
jgi:hypothetical protein